MSVPSSLLELASWSPRRKSRLLRGAFEVVAQPSARIVMNEEAWAQTADVFKVPRADVESQAIVYTRDLGIGTEATINPLRSRRVAPGSPRVESRAEPVTPCRWCDPAGWGAARHELWVDDFGLSTLAGVSARPNWARQAPISGIVFGPREMHDLRGLDHDAFVSLFKTAADYIRRAHVARPTCRFFMVIVNGGARSAASVDHAHIQVVGRPDHHFMHAEAIAERAPRGYWARLTDVHADAGLLVAPRQGTVWANLVPTKDGDFSAITATLVEGASLLHGVLADLQTLGSDSYSLAAILAPWYVTGSRRAGRFADFPPVLWRLVSRGSTRARHADIGSLELFGTPVIGTDPFIARASLRPDGWA